MARIRNHLAGTACACALFVLASCNSGHVHRAPSRGPHIGQGPPAHAQAHGYRRKQVCGYDLVYDSGCGVYVVMGMAECYYHEGHFYRLRGDVWEISVRADGGWKPAGRTALPPGLRAKTRAKAQVAVKNSGGAKVAVSAKANEPAKGKSKGKGKGFAKGKR